jgi:hypothetical protein
VVVDEHTGEPVVMRESVGYIHHWIGSIFDRDRLPGDTGARVAGNLRSFLAAGERVRALSTRPAIPLAVPRMGDTGRAFRR